MPDKLLIHALTANCCLGVTDEERARPQPVWIDLEVEIDAARAAVRDDVHATVDYARLVGDVQQLAQGKSYGLLETMAEEIAALVLQACGTPQVLVRVTKRALPGIDSASVEITRAVS